ncbi:glycosyltransferase family 87 protein [Nocardioides sp.]|uniref:glycosyltransferase family 87 protein n=1 Tax=Nocardioides sp. TaxID=35761 RepID=UPI00286DFA38|nr:glycosyltransferase family 87 protein [Nocardioides sp.]
MWQIIPLGGLGYDSHAYWLAARSDHPYLQAPGDQDAYLYSPFFLQLISPLSWLPWRGFMAVWVVIEAACLVWLTGPMRWRWRAPVLMLCALEIAMGNIIGLLGVMMVLGLRRPGVWAFGVLTKITPGAMGVIWFAARREWAAVARLVGWTSCLTLVSYALSPGLWQEWLHFLMDTSDGEAMITRVRGSSPLSSWSPWARVVMPHGRCRWGCCWVFPTSG